MTRRPSRFRRLGRVVAFALLALVIVAGALVVRAEWAHRRGDPVVAWTPAPGAVDTARGADDRRPVLILLHGAGLNGRMYDAVVRALGGEFRAIAPDLPGHGSRRAERFTLASATATVQAVAASVAPAPVFLVGDSLGGYVAMEAAATIPRDQLRGLVVGGASADWGHAQTLHWIRDVVVFTAVLAGADEREFAARALAAYGVAERDRGPMIDAGVNLGAVSIAARTLLYGRYRAKVAALRVPVLIVNGDGDTRAMEQHAAFVAAAATGESRVFAGTPHGVTLWKPAEFAALVEDFARRHAAGTPPAPAPSTASRAPASRPPAPRTAP